MMNVSNILVPVDFSKTAKTAARLAIDWSNILQCSVTLIHNYRLILEGQTPDKSPRAIRETLVNEKLKKFHQFDQEIDFNKAHSLTTKLELGFTIDSIRRMAAKGEADLIIYGVKSNKSSNSTSVLKKILEAQLAPVLIVSGEHEVTSEEPFDQLKNKIITVDFEILMSKFDSHISVLDSVPNQSYLIHPVKNSANQIKTNYSSIADRIINFSKSN